MWIIKNLCRDRSTEDIRTTDISFHLAGNNGDGWFTTLEPLKWHEQSNSSQSIFIEFECINEIKNLKKALKKIIKNWEKENKKTIKNWEKENSSGR